MQKLIMKYYKTIGFSDLNDTSAYELGMLDLKAIII